jgi:hypothetical protein
VREQGRHHADFSAIGHDREAEIRAVLRAAFGPEAEATWLNARWSDFGGKTTLELLREKHGIATVRELILRSDILGELRWPGYE